MDVEIDQQQKEKQEKIEIRQAKRENKIEKNYFKAVLNNLKTSKILQKDDDMEYLLQNPIFDDLYSLIEEISNYREEFLNYNILNPKEKISFPEYLSSINQTELSSFVKTFLQNTLSSKNLISNNEINFRNKQTHFFKKNFTEEQLPSSFFSNDSLLLSSFINYVLIDKFYACTNFQNGTFSYVSDDELKQINEGKITTGYFKLFQTSDIPVYVKTLLCFCEIQNQNDLINYDCVSSCDYNEFFFKNPPDFYTKKNSYKVNFVIEFTYKNKKMLSYHLDNLLVYITEKALAPPIENAIVQETNLKIKNLKLFHKTPKNKQFLKIFPFTSGKKQFDEKKRSDKITNPYIGLTLKSNEQIQTSYLVKTPIKSQKTFYQFYMDNIDFAKNLVITYKNNELEVTLPFTQIDEKFTWILNIPLFLALANWKIDFEKNLENIQNFYNSIYSLFLRRDVITFMEKLRTSFISALTTSIKILDGAKESTLLNAFFTIQKAFLYIEVFVNNVDPQFKTILKTICSKFSLIYLHNFLELDLPFLGKCLKNIFFLINSFSAFPIVTTDENRKNLILQLKSYFYCILVKIKPSYLSKNGFSWEYINLNNEETFYKIVSASFKDVSELELYEENTDKPLTVTNDIKKDLVKYTDDVISEIIEKNAAIDEKINSLRQDITQQNGDPTGQALEIKNLKNEKTINDGQILQLTSDKNTISNLPLNSILQKGQNIGLKSPYIKTYLNNKRKNDDSVNKINNLEDMIDTTKKRRTFKTVKRRKAKKYSDTSTSSTFYGEKKPIFIVTKTK